MTIISGDLDPYCGVPPNLFVDERIKLWKEHGNIPSSKLKSAWELLAGKLNEHLSDYDNSRRGMMYRFCLETGGGKSTGLQLYFGMLAGIAKVSANCPAALITAQRIEDCDQFQKRVNELGKLYGMKEPMATAYHSQVNKKKVKYSELKQWPFLITTQKGLTISLIECEIDDLFWHRLPSFLKYKYNDPLKIAESLNKNNIYDLYVGRHMILMDEALDPYATFSISCDTIDDLFDNIPQKIAEKHIDILKDILDLKREILLHKKFNSDSEIAKLDAWRKSASSVVPLMNSLRSHKDQKDFIQMWTAFQKLIAIWHLQNDEAFYKVKGNVHSFFKADFILDRLNRGVFILDATAKTSKLLDIYRPLEDVKLDRTRNYKNLRIEADRSTRTGRNTIVGEGGQNIERTADRIIDELMSLNSDEWNQVGVITFKDVVSAINAKRLKYPVSVVFGNIGGVTGSNAFQECDLLYIIGQNHRAPDYGSDIKRAAEEYLKYLKDICVFDVSYDLVQEQGVEIPEWNAQMIQDHELARDLIQTIGRGCNRRVVDNKGNCKPSTVRITMDENYALATFLERMIRENFYKVDYIDRGWSFIKDLDYSWEDADKEYEQSKDLTGLALSKGGNNIESTVWWFYLSGLTKKSVYSIVKQFGWNKTNHNKIRKALINDNGRNYKKYHNLMGKLGITIKQLPNGKRNMSWCFVRD